MEKTPKTSAILEVIKHHSAIYWDEVRCRFEAHPGKIKYDETTITESFYFSHTPNDYALEIIEVKEDEISYVVPSCFCTDGKDMVDTLHRGEAKKYTKTYKSSTLWEGDEWDYEVTNRLEVKWE